MSDPVSQPDIEDVLASIRRLVSEDGRPAERRRPATGNGRLVLTPALRVHEPAQAERPAEETDGDDAQGAVFRHAEAEALRKGLSGAAERRGDEAVVWPVDSAEAGDDAVEDDGDDTGAAGGDDAAEVPAGPAPAAEASTPGPERGSDASIAEDEGWVTVPVQHEPVDELIFATPGVARGPAAPPEPAPTAEAPAENAAAETAAQDQAWPNDATTDIGGADEAAAWDSAEAVPGDEMATPPPEDGTAEAETVRPVSLEEKIAELEALLNRDDSSWDDEGAAAPAPATEDEALPWEDDVAEDGADTPAGPASAIPEGDTKAATPAWDVVTPVAVVPDTAAGDEAPEWERVEPAAAIPEAVSPVSNAQEEDVVPDTAAPRGVEDLAPDPAAPDEEDGSAAEAPEPEGVIDEAALRELVAQIVREELQGKLGERITRNVRKLVRREIHRALTAQDLD